MIKIPDYLKSIADEKTRHIEEDVLLKFDLAKGTSKLFEVFYVGEIEMFDEDPYILSNDDELHQLFVRVPGSTELLAVYNGIIHGYDNMFCDEYETKEAKPVQLQVDGCKLFSIKMTLGYSIDYEDEKDDYGVDENGMVDVLNRDEKISWEQAKEEGYDWIAMEIVSEKGKTVFLEKELA